MFKVLLFCFFSMVAITTVHAACLSDQKVQQLVAGYPNTPVKGVSEVSSLEDAYCTQKKYVALLRAKGSALVGYKIGFTGKGSQTRFKMAGPASGVLLDTMFLDDHSVVKKDFGFRPLIEPDFMVVINDEAIMQAKSPRDTLAFIESVHPLLELPAVQLHADEPMSGYSIVALNIAATYMVAGQGIEAENSDDFYTALGHIQTVFRDMAGVTLQTAKSDTLMMHPLNALFWLIEQMRERGEYLKAGDKISLGATGRLFPIQSEHYHYEFQWPSGKTQSVSVNFK